jgi:hypothetical protein
MWFEDLGRCTYFPADVPLVAVGWLDFQRPFATGTTDRTVYLALIGLLKNPWQPMVSAGFHECNLCQFEAEARGVANLFVPADGKIFVCPELIVHYINAHGYKPPENFCAAVLSCPPMRSMQYLKAISSQGGARMIRHER